MMAPGTGRSSRYLGFVSVGLVLLGWFLITEDGLGLVKPVKFPSPRKVFEGAQVVSHVLALDILVTMGRVLIGWGAGVLGGIAFGLLISFSAIARSFFHPLIEMIRPVPAIALIPFFLMWFGISETGKFLLIFLMVVMYMIVNTVEAVSNVPPIYVRAAQALGASPWQIFRRIICHAILPQLIGPLRAGVAGAYTLAVAAEFMGGEYGVGYRMLEARRLFNTDVILMGVVLFGLMSGFTDWALRKTMGHLTRWSERPVQRST